MADVSLKIGADAGLLRTGLSQAQNSIASFAASATKQLAGALSFGAIAAGLKSAIDKGDQLQDIAEKFNISASKLQMLGNAAAVYGSGIENVSAGLNKLSLAQQKAVAGDTNLQDTFREVGISMQELKAMSPEDIFLKISDSFASGANDGRQFLIVNELLGKAQTDLIKVMNQGSAAIIEQGNSMGVWSDETIRQLSEASDAIKTFQNNITIGFGYAATLANGLVKAYHAVVESLVLLGAAAKEAFAGNLDGAKQLVKAAQNVGNERMAREAQAAKAKATVGPAGDFTDPKEQEKQAKALEELKAGFREVERGKQKRADDEEHRAAMQRAEELGRKIDEQNQKRKEDRDLAVQGLDALIAKKEAEITPAGAIASSLQRIGGLGEANVGVDTADTQLDELRALRNQLKEIEQRVPDTLDEIRDLLATGGATLS